MIRFGTSGKLYYVLILYAIMLQKLKFQAAGCRPYYEICGGSLPKRALPAYNDGRWIL
jgi:hypothetical protein